MRSKKRPMAGGWKPARAMNTAPISSASSSNSRLYLSWSATFAPSGAPPEPGAAGGAGRPQSGGARQQRRPEGLLGATRIVVPLHVADLVAHHSRQLVDAGGLEDRGAGEGDVAAREGEGVGGRGRAHAGAGEG